MSCLSFSVCLAVSLSLSLSLSLSSRQVSNVSLKVHGQETVTVDRLSLRHTVDGRDDLIVGAAFQELKCRQAACMLPTGAVRDREEGFLVTVQGATVRVDTSELQIAHAMDGLMLEVQAMIGVLLTLPGRWIPESSDFRRVSGISRAYWGLGGGGAGGGGGGGRGEKGGKGAGRPRRGTSGLHWHCLP